MTRKFSEEHRKAIAKTVKKLWKNPEYRKRLTIKHNSPETLQKHRASGLASINDKMLERARKLGASSKGKQSPRKGTKLSQTTKNKIRQYNTRPDILLAHRLRGQKIASKIRKSGTDIERKIWTLLKTLGISFKSNSKLGFLVPDVLIEKSKLIIECDGDYWHSSIESKKRLKRRDRQFKKLGYKVLHLLGSEINKNLEKCKRKILFKV